MYSLNQILRVWFFDERKMKKGVKLLKGFRRCYNPRFLTGVISFNSSERVHFFRKAQTKP